METKESHLYKVLIVGDFAVGKTSLIARYARGEFSNNYKLTIGVDFSTKTLEIDDNNVTLQLWDIAGHERFGGLTRVYYKYAIAAALVFDVTRPSTLESVKKWKSDIDDKVMLPNEEPIPMILLANKADLNPDLESLNLDQFIEENGFLAWFPTSAKTNLNIDEAFQGLTQHILKLTQSMKLPNPNKREQTGDDAVLLGKAHPSSTAQRRDTDSTRRGCCT